MPETLGERLVFLAGVLLIGFLIAAIVFRPKTSDPAAAPRADTVRGRTLARTTTRPAPPVVTTASVPTTAAAAPTTSTETAGTTTTTAASNRIELRVAARDDTWLSIRRGSATGDILFEGTLAKGDSRRYTASRFYVRFGAAANVSASVDGKPLNLPGGTYSVTISRGGLGPRSA
jgi:cytoskeletal protein RodZ